VKPETRSFYQLAVQRAVDRVVNGLDEALDLEELARSAALSAFHFHRIFRGMVGETPLEMHRRLRLERAAYFLRDGDAPVTTIAFDAGYDTHEAFTRAFRARYACSPSEFRQNEFHIQIAAVSGIHFEPERAESPLVHFIEGEIVMDVQIKDMKELRTATLRHVGPYNQISEAFQRLGDIAGKAGLLKEKPTMLAIYHDDPETTPEAELTSEAAIVVPEDAKIPAGLEEQRVPGGRYATTTHVGPYEKLGDVWARVMGQWLPKSGERLADSVSYEIYRNTPMEVPKEQLKTEIYVPLA
jgi:AraC family transcriptional regulator